MIGKGEKINIAMVGYHNTLPFLYGLQNAKETYNLILDVPSKCMDFFVNDEADIALVPVATLLDASNYRIVTDYCIGCVGEVGTVCLYGNQPVDFLDTIWLDSDSRTSQLLTKILIEHHWNVDVDYKEVNARNINPKDVPSGTGVLMIGDKAFGMDEKYEFSYDLGGEWQAMTHLPFAFAVWIAKPYIDESIINKLNETLGIGVHDIDLVLDANKELAHKINLQSYFEEYIDFDYDAGKRRAFEVYRELGSKIVHA